MGTVDSVQSLIRRCVRVVIAGHEYNPIRVRHYWGWCRPRGPVIVIGTWSVSIGDLLRATRVPPGSAPHCLAVPTSQQVCPFHTRRATPIEIGGRPWPWPPMATFSAGFLTLKGSGPSGAGADGGASAQCPMQGGATCRRRDEPGSTGLGGHLGRGRAGTHGIHGHHRVEEHRFPPKVHVRVRARARGA
jgi:hypothetical protein